MSQRQSPQAEVGRGVRNAAEHELDSLDWLVHKHIASVELKFTFVVR